jgi:hypothetical protein
MEGSRGRMESALTSIEPGTGDDVYLTMQSIADHAASLRIVTGHVAKTGAALAKTRELWVPPAFSPDDDLQTTACLSS